jgi:hypothetical protein
MFRLELGEPICSGEKIHFIRAFTLAAFTLSIRSIRCV